VYRVVCLEVQFSDYVARKQDFAISGILTKTSPGRHLNMIGRTFGETFLSERVSFDTIHMLFRDYCMQFM
jgi:hypothetical protein